MITPIDIEKLRITVIYDNFGGNGKLRADWGFSCFIEGPEQTILFDTGLDAAIFAHNMEGLKISPKQVDLLLMGGFHLSPHGEGQIRRIVDEFKRLGVRYAAPCHCSGALARRCFKEAYGARYIEAGVGTVVTGADFKPASH